MKNVFFAAVVIALCSCTQNPDLPYKKIAISLIADTTDIVSVVPKADPILQLYQLEKYPDAEAFFRFKVIKNVKLVPVTSYHLPSTTNMKTGGDPQYRKRAIVQFYTEVRNSINQFKSRVQNSSELPNSECYYTICEELKHLAQNTYDTKVLIVLSNLFEKSFVNVYTQHNLSSLQLSTLFEKMYPLPLRLEGIKIFFVFNPRDRVEDKRYDVIVTAYKNMLERRGAMVIVQADAEQFL